MPASGSNMAMAQAFVNRLEANGGTEMDAALQFALRTPPQHGYLRQIIFVTDGAVGNEEALFKLIEARLGAARLFTVGIGSAPNALFMTRAAKFGRGSFTYIGSTDEVEQRIGELFERLSAPVLTDVRLESKKRMKIEEFMRGIKDLPSWKVS